MNQSKPCGCVEDERCKECIGVDEIIEVAHEYRSAM